MIRLPNNFQGKNITAKLEFTQTSDISSLYNDLSEIPKEIRREIENTKKFYITFSEMESTVNKKVTIKYNEIIVKIPVVYKGNNYIFPIVSYVSNTYSLIRGFYLGFNKDNQFELVKSNENISFIKTGVMDICIENACEKNEWLKEEQNTELSFPFLLFLNTNLIENRRKSNILSTQNYEKSTSEILYIKEKRVGTVLNKAVYCSELYYTEDTFQVTGIKEVD